LNGKPVCCKRKIIPSKSIKNIGNALVPVIKVVPKRIEIVSPRPILVGMPVL